MTGHSKWATTKHKKAVVDAKRGKMFAKLIKNIEVAARTGGGDPAGNPTLYDAIQKAKKTSVPNDNIDRAVKRGSGAEAGGADYQTIMYEGYAPGGVAVLIECLTDNRNRAAAEVRTAMTRNGGTLADPGSRLLPVHPQGRRHRAARSGQPSEDDVLAAVLDAGAEEVNDLGDSFEVVSEATDLVAVRTALQDAGIDYDSAEVDVRAQRARSPLDEDGARKVFRLIDALEDSDDVQNVYANFDVSDEVMASWTTRLSARSPRVRPTGHPAARRRPGGVACAVRRAPVYGGSEHVFGSCAACAPLTEEVCRARARRRPRADPVRHRRRRRRARPAADAGRRRRRPHARRRPTSPQRLLALSRPRSTQWLRPAPPDVVAVERVFSQHNVAHRDGHRAGRRRRHAGRRAARPAGRAAHAERGQGRRHRQRPGRQGAGRPPWSPGCSGSTERPEAGRRRRRARAGHLPPLARSGAAPADRRPGPPSPRPGPGAGGRR